MTRFTDRELEDLRARHPVPAVAGQWVKLRARRVCKGFTHTGPCPLCSKSNAKGDERFACGPDTWVCAAGCGGGNVIQLLMRREGLDFIAAVERLGGVRAPEETPETARRAGRGAFARGLPRDPVPEEFCAQPSLAAAYVAGWSKAKRQADYEGFARERERKRLYDQYWAKAAPFPGTPVETYLALRGLMVPPNAKLRYLADVPYFKTGDEQEPEVLHRGLAMLAAIRAGLGVFSGLHFTWFDLSDGAAPRKFKALIVDPEAGEALKAKKSRGTKQGCYIDLGGVPESSGSFTRQFSGEGIESTLAVYTALVKSGRDVTGIAWRCGIDLGNLTGSAETSERHPTLKDKAGRARRVPGRVPDMNSPAMPVIAGVRELVQLADGDSDAFTTHCAMERGETRRRAEGVPIVRTIWPPAGLDFNDWLLKAESKGEAA